MGIAGIMLGMGMSLTLDDFKRVWIQPKPVFIGIILQIIGLPLLGLAFVSIIGPDPVTAAAIMILSACPGRCHHQPYLLYFKGGCSTFGEFNQY